MVQLFDLMVVQKWYLFSRSHISRFKFCFFPRLAMCSPDAGQWVSCSSQGGPLELTPALSSGLCSYGFGCYVLSTFKVGQAKL